MALLDVIIPQWNQVAYTQRCIESIRKYAPEGTRIILVDNGSSPFELLDAQIALGDFPNIVISNSKNLGFVRGTNIGLCASDADYIVFQNNDTEIFEGTYQRMMAVLKARPDAGAVGPLCSPNDCWQAISNKNLPICWPEIRGRLETLGDKASGVLLHSLAAHNLGVVFKGESREAPGMVAFFCTMFPRKTIERVGLLSTEFGMGFGDDDDYCIRIQKNQMKVYLALDSYVYHAHRTTFKANFSEVEITRMKEENLAKFKKKWNK
jgi:GT2 family glycosyltransferase